MLWHSRVDAWPESRVGKNPVSLAAIQGSHTAVPMQAPEGHRGCLSPWLPKSARSLAPLGTWAWKPGETSLSSHRIPLFSICQATGDPEAVLWLEEIRQEVVRANQDTDAAQRSKWAGVAVGGSTGGERVWGRRGDVGSVGAQTVR